MGCVVKIKYIVLSLLEGFFSFSFDLGVARFCIFKIV